MNTTTALPTILVAIHYPVDVGYAIGRLVSVFYRMAVNLTGEKSRVHFSFTDLKVGRCESLPDDFTNYIQFQPRGHDAESVRRLLQYIRDKNVTVLFGFDLDVEAPYLKDVRKAGVKAIISYYGAPLSSILPLPILVLKRLEVKWLRPSKPDLIVVESKAMFATAVRGRGIPPQMVRIVRNGVNLRQFPRNTESRELVYLQFQIPRHRSIVVYMGHFHERKGVHVLLRAAIHICRDLGRSDVHFLFLGTTPRDVERIGNKIDYSTISGNLTFGGYQTQVAELLAGCTIGCTPTTGWDSFPLSPLEMQASSLPVVVSDCQGLPETVQDQVTGLVVPAGDHIRLARAILTLIDDQPMRRRMSDAARLRIESELTDDIQVNALASVVRDAWIATRGANPTAER